MAVVSWREVIGRNLSHKFGETPTASRKFISTLDNPNSSAQEIINEIGIFHMAAHPEYTFLSMTNVTVSMGTPSAFHAEVNYDYELVQENVANPLQRKDIWSFTTGGVSVPAFTYYEEDDSIKPLVNSAKDYFEGAMTEESEVRATISGNRPFFPLSVAVAVTNTLNNAPYLGGAIHTWKCAGISAQQTSEMVEDAEVKYWQVSVELIFRPTGWPLQLPDVGYNYIEGGQKKRAYVLDPEDGSTKLPCANPVALNSNGSLKSAGQFPDIRKRRVHGQSDFSEYFGTPDWA